MMHYEIVTLRQQLAAAYADAARERERANRAEKAIAAAEAKARHETEVARRQIAAAEEASRAAWRVAFGPVRRVERTE